MDIHSLYVEPEAASTKLEWPALECHDVFKIFHAGSTETVALRGVSLRAERKEFIALLGPSGSGKSTLLSLIAGLDLPSAGEVRVFGRSLARMDQDALARYRADDLGVIFQSGNLWPLLTAQENVATALRLAKINNPRAAAAEALAEFGLADRLHQRASTLSGGEQQRVAIAAAAARKAPLVLADEPTGELDEKNERVVVDALTQLCEQFNSTVVVVTHAQEVAARVDRVVELRDGKISS